MILMSERQLIIFKAYVPIAPVTQGREGKILLCRKRSGASLPQGNKKARQGRAF
ncbi:hypothetical protein [Shinella zoogloeoides]|uniref:hypothetical protein n=1 Tax=Shinella zoogloeoides TaxID=352475 RepID=UPI0013C30FBF|nr:hypothetical protein [Shinella zoogloeoides]